ncbi:colanic acid biosynthesis protein [Bacillus freudenreichii]|nr:colanic acid biosynthesis protein [Bacillus freudenreichii]
MKKRILVNAYFAKNLGDDLFLKVLFDRYPNVIWSLLTPNLEYEKIFNNYRNVKIIKSLLVKVGPKRFNLFQKLNDLLLNYNGYDAFLTIGGSIFMENSRWKEVLVQKRELPERFKKNNKKNFILGANFGPYTNKLFLDEHRNFFKLFDDICFRDSYSYNLFPNEDNVRFAPDIVFNLQKSLTIEKEKCVAVSVICLQNRKELKQYSEMYYQKVIQLMERYIIKGYKIKLCSFCEREGDLEIINYLINKINTKYKNQIKVINYHDDIDTFLDEFEKCEVVIGTRFHSVILAFIFNQGILPIIYSDKTYNVLKDLNMDQNVCHISKINELDIENVVLTSSSNKLNNKEIFIKAAQQFKKLDDFLQYRGTVEIN